MYPIFSSTIKAFNSERRFLVSSYTASHGLLLLRSVRDDIHKTRVDILFQDVRALELRMWFDGIDLQGLVRDGYELPGMNRVQNWYNMPGGGTEMQFPYAIPARYLMRLH